MTSRTVEHAASILIVEDRDEVRDLIQRALASRGYQVHTACDGESGFNAALDLSPDLVILDVGLPKQSGFDVARELRRRGFLAPVLMLTAYNTVTDKVAGLEAGADDYLGKPFDYNELLARVNALLRRAALRAGEAVIHVGDLSVDTIARVVTRGDREISLTQKEYALLEYLARNAGRPLTREQISEQVWKSELDPRTNIVDVYINYLRKKLETEDAPQLLHTVRGTGYVLREPE
jgi:DNA-binding response OmpR family regulator